jgi:hypothetical protein
MSTLRTTTLVAILHKSSLSKQFGMIVELRYLMEAVTLGRLVMTTGNLNDRESYERRRDSRKE